MNAPIQALIKLGVIPPVSFPADSRYHGSPTLTYVTPGGRPSPISPGAFCRSPARRTFQRSPSIPSGKATGSIFSQRNIWAIRSCSG